MLSQSVLVQRTLAWPDPADKTDKTGQDVELYTCAWVQGTRVQGYFGPISSDIFLRDSEVANRSAAWPAALDELLESLRDKARVRGANAVIGLEVSLDPFARCPRSGVGGLYLHAIGTAARLEVLL